LSIQLKNIYKSYNNDQEYAVEDFNIDIDDREFIVFVGPSGCGKSTTLRMIAGLEEITAGELYINNELMNDVEPKDRGIAMVFQNYALYPHMTVRENMSYGLRVRKYSKDVIEERVKEAADILGLHELLDRKPTALSGGQRQRVALGRAVVREADVFLMDEPLSNLDAKLRVHMRTELARLHERLDTTTIYVTHDQTEAMTLATRLVVMNDGVIQQVGTPEEVYDHPENIFVASFLGSPAMNFIEVTYDDGIITNGKSLSMKETEPQRKVLEQNGYHGKRIILGIRPEDIHTELIAIQSSINDSLTLSVEVSELTGAETIVYSDLDGVEIIARLNNREKLMVGDEYQVIFDMNKAHFFDPVDEKVIRKVQEPVSS